MSSPDPTSIPAIPVSEPAILVSIRAAFGSTPREAGAAMVVRADGIEGTIGGGRLEMMAIETARAMLASDVLDDTRSVPLGPEIGQCCGGRVDLAFERVTPRIAAALAARRHSEEWARPCVMIYGAGHTGRALARALAPLPVAVTLVDSRPATLSDLPAGITAHAAAVPEALVATAPPRAAHVVLTHDHGLDFLIASAALERSDAAYVGMIGSATKRARFARHLAEAGRAGDIERLTLPIGGATLRDKRPEVIAALVAAELLHCLFSGQQQIDASSLGSEADAVQ